MLILNESKINEDLDQNIGPENPEHDAMIMESVLLDEMPVDKLIEAIEAGEFDSAIFNENILSERTIVRLDKQAKKNKALKQAVFAVARENNDKLFKKLVTVFKLRRLLERKLEQKYAMKAQKRVRENISKARKSSVVTIKDSVAKAVKKITK